MKTYERSNKAQRTGLLGEHIVKRKIERLGYDVLWTAKLDVGYDLLVNNTLRVEVKTARLSKGNYYQFCLTKCGHADITKSDVVVLQCIQPNGCIVCFVVPTHVIATRKQIKISAKLETYKGLVADYKL